MAQFKNITYVVVILVAGFFLGRETKQKAPSLSSNLPKVIFPRPTQNRFNSPPKTEIIENSKTEPVQTNQNSKAASLNSKEVLLSAQGENLFRELFDNKIFSHLSFHQSMALMEKRFEKSYVSGTHHHKSYEEKEIAARVGILKAFQDHFAYEKLPALDRQRSVAFQKSIASNENEKFLLRVQASRGLKAYWTTLSPSIRTEEQMKMSSQILHLASKTNRQIAEDALGSHE